ncbi:MAG: hypothetical protein ABGX83_05930 [Nitrospira sp.]|nr:hypothetical protein [Candidatus Manganitrophaceae bacterium]HIL35104.1 hypothetical protein [Candidatus Manganitrophaceae bacterium]
MKKPHISRPVVRLGNSKKNILESPQEVRKLIGDELQLIQYGEMPKDAKPFKGELLSNLVYEIFIKRRPDLIY